MDNAISFDPVKEDWPWVWALRDDLALDWSKDCSDKNEIQAQKLRQSDLPVKISDSVYLSDAASIENVPLLEALEITGVLNMAGSYVLPQDTIGSLRDRGIQYKEIDAEDDDAYPLLEAHFSEAKEFIDGVINPKEINKGTAAEKGRCVVHCLAGINRSCLIVAAYHSLTTQTPVLDTVKLIRKQRGSIALENTGFQEQLVAFARHNNLLGAMPGTEASFIKAVPTADDWYVF